MNVSDGSRFDQEKQAYWRMRSELLLRYPDKWVAIVGGKVVAVGEKKMAVLKQAFDLTRSAVGYITCVGQEEHVGKKRLRSIVAGKYDQRYAPPIPIKCFFRRHSVTSAEKLWHEAPFVVKRHSFQLIQKVELPWKKASKSSAVFARPSKNCWCQS